MSTRQRSMCPVLVLITGLFITNCGDLTTKPDKDRPGAWILAPADSSEFVHKQVVTFIGTGVSEEGDTLTGDALTWMSDKDGLLGTGNSCSAGSLSVNMHTVTLMVMDTDSGISLAEISLTIAADSAALARKHPEAQINLPVDKAVYNQGDSVFFSGTGISIAGDTLSGDVLTWISDKDGQIGTDSGFVAWWLSPNKHVITLLVAENDTDIAMDRIELTIMADTSQAETGMCAVINEPVSNAVFSADDTIVFRGMGTGGDGSDLSGSRLVWLSDKDGELGTDTMLEVTGLSADDHKITLMVTDTDENIAVKTINITVTAGMGSAPTAVFTVSPDTGTVQTVFAVDASGVSDPQDTVTDLQVRWDFGNTGTFTSWAKSKTEEYVFTETGRQTIVMEVKDADDMVDSYSRTVFISNTAPVSDFQAVPGKGDTATTFQFDASDCTDLEDQDSGLEIRWDWEGDGLWDTFWSTTKTGSATYDTVGVKTIILEVRDSGRLTDTDTVTVEVQ